MATSCKRRKTEVSVEHSKLEDTADILAGRVERLQMTNFMCHNNLEVTFNPRINFISGRNGSGKSAVMAALVVVLGGTASVTSRAVNIADLIMKGQNQARVTIVLMNVGSNAYKSDLYGNRIIIMRTFTRNGTTTWTIKSADGNIMSKKKSEVDRIRDALNLQIKNPICILNQDVARSFLSSADPGVRFNIFMAATQLDELQKRYSTAYCNLLQARTDLERKIEVIKEQKTMVLQANQKVKLVAELDKKEEEKAALENEFLWALVHEGEKSLEKLQAQKQHTENTLAELRRSAKDSEALAELERNFGEKQSALEKALKERGQFANRRQPMRERMKDADRCAATAREKLKGLETKQKRIEADLARIQGFCQDFERSSDQSQSERSEIRGKIGNIQSQLRETRDRIEAAQRDVDNGQETRLAERRKMNDLSEEINILEVNQRNTEAKLRGTENNEDPVLIRLGAFMPNLIKEIDRFAERGGFLSKPVGPFGKHVQLKCESKWAVGVEQAIGRLMPSFTCDNHKDESLLIRIMEKLNIHQKPSIIVSKFQKGRHDVKNKKVRASRGALSLLDVLDIDHDVVFNALIDQAGIESILLFENDQQASMLCSHIENIPEGFRVGYTMAGDRYCPAPSYRSYAGPGPNTIPRYFGRDSRREDTISRLKELACTQRSEMEMKRTALQEVKRRMVEIDQFNTHSEARLRELRNKKVLLETELRSLEDQEASMPVMPTRVALEEELNNLEKTKRDLKDQMAELKRLENTHLETKDSMEKQLAELLKEENALQEGIRNLEEKRDLIEAQIRNQKNIRKNADQQIKSLNAILKELEEKREVVEKQVEISTKNATEMCERVVTNRESALVRREIEKCTKYIKAAEKINGSRDEVIEECRKISENYAKLRRNRDVHQEVLNFFNEKIVFKVERFRTIQNHTARHVSHYFSASLQTRGYAGCLKFDFENKILNLEVTPRQTDGPARTDSKTLSGGERSYSTVSFILAIWQSIKMPFYFLDEFDVFMDKVNRKVILDLLLANAQSKTHTQYVFITPQDISSVEASDIIAIYKMPDPERNEIIN